DRRRTRQFDEQFRDSALDGFLDRDVRPLEPVREPGELRGIETLLRKQMHQTAQARAREAWIAIGWIVSIRNSGGVQCCDQSSLWNLQERTNDKKLFVLRHGGDPLHCPETGDPAAAAHANENGLALVVERVRRKNMCRASPAGGLAKQSVPRQASGFLQAGLRLAAGPARCAMLNIELARETCHSGRLRFGFLAQP